MSNTLKVSYLKTIFTLIICKILLSLQHNIWNQCLAIIFKLLEWNFCVHTVKIDFKSHILTLFLAHEKQRENYSNVLKYITNRKQNLEFLKKCNKNTLQRLQSTV